MGKTSHELVGLKMNVFYRAQNFMGKSFNVGTDAEQWGLFAVWFLLLEIRGSLTMIDGGINGRISGL